MGNRSKRRTREKSSSLFGTRDRDCCVIIFLHLSPRLVMQNIYFFSKKKKNNWKSCLPIKAKIVRFWKFFKNQNFNSFFKKLIFPTHKNINFLKVKFMSKHTSTFNIIFQLNFENSFVNRKKLVSMAKRLCEKSFW